MFYNQHNYNQHKMEEQAKPEQTIPGPSAEKKRVRTKAVTPTPALAKQLIDVDKIHAGKYETTFFTTLNGHKFEVRHYPDGHLVEVIVSDKYLHRSVIAKGHNPLALPIGDNNLK
jgi:hypothetical protein